MSEIEMIAIEKGIAGVKKFDEFLDQLPDEFFGQNQSSKTVLQKKFKQIFEADPFQPTNQIMEKLYINLLLDETCPDTNGLKQILKIGFNTDFAKIDLPKTTKPSEDYN